jgi:hypothetical protein
MDILSLLIGLVPAGLPDLDEQDVQARAEAAFARGIQAGSRAEAARPAFAEAADAFHELARRGAHNPDLFRNLGNASLLAGRLPEAILAYHHGLRLAPADRSLQAGLEAARDQVNYPPASRTRPTASAWLNWRSWFAPEVLLGLALAIHALAWVLAVRWLITRRAGLAVLVAFGLTLALAGMWALGQAQEAREARHPLVVVTNDGATLHVGNGPSYPPHHDLPTLVRGLEARQRFARGDWVQVDLPGGVSGWVRRSDVLLSLR